MKNPTLAFILILLAALWRILSAFEPSLSNVAPITALAFCGAAYFRDWRWWLIPFLALMLSDLWLNYYHATRFGFAWSWAKSCSACSALLRPWASAGSWRAGATGSPSSRRACQLPDLLPRHQHCRLGRRSLLCEKLGRLVPSLDYRPPRISLAPSGFSATRCWGICSLPGFSP